jgi:hypothetical protein
MKIKENHEQEEFGYQIAHLTEEEESKIQDLEATLGCTLIAYRRPTTEIE